MSIFNSERNVIRYSLTAVNLITDMPSYKKLDLEILQSKKKDFSCAIIFFIVKIKTMNVAFTYHQEIIKLCNEEKIHRNILFLQPY